MGMAAETVTERSGSGHTKATIFQTVVLDVAGLLYVEENHERERERVREGRRDGKGRGGQRGKGRVREEGREAR